MNRTNTKLLNLILHHNNDYGFNVDNILKKKNIKIESISIIIPYFNSKNTINILLKALFVALKNAKKYSESFDYQIIVIDDGSNKNTAEQSINKNFRKNIDLVILNKNYGRSHAREIGLQQAEKKVILFLDSDIIISPNLILDHLKIHGHCQKKPLILANTFYFCTFENFNILLKNLNTKKIKSNDFRINCVYDKTWIGCKEDKKYISKKFHIIEDTQEFKKWPTNKKYGPWLLPNMVLGGAFSVKTKYAKSVNGMELKFKQYGFTETPFVTKIIALHDACVVPMTKSIAIHIDDNKISINKKKKDQLFKKAHSKYFNHYLNLTLKKALK
jgi:glycosyltransferase involved in cell wall biosynthesis